MKVNESNSLMFKLVSIELAHKYHVRRISHKEILLNSNLVILKRITRGDTDLGCL